MSSGILHFEARKDFLAFLWIHLHATRPIFGIVNVAEGILL